MRLHTHRRNLVVFSSSVDPVDIYGAPRHKRPARTGRIRRNVRIGALLTVIAVRPRWWPLLAGAVLTVTGFTQRGNAAGVVLIPGLLLFWHALLITADTDADRQRRAELARELAAYSTPAQQCDLEATLDRYPDGITREIRDILASQALAAHDTGNRAGHPWAGRGRAP